MDPGLRVRPPGPGSPGPGRAPPLPRVQRRPVRRGQAVQGGGDRGAPRAGPGTGAGLAPAGQAARSPCTRTGHPQSRQRVLPATRSREDRPPPAGRGLRPPAYRDRGATPSAGRLPCSRPGRRRTWCGRASSRSRGWASPSGRGSGSGPRRASSRARGAGRASSAWGPPGSRRGGTLPGTTPRQWSAGSASRVGPQAPRSSRARPARPPGAARGPGGPARRRRGQGGPGVGRRRHRGSPRYTGPGTVFGARTSHVAPWEAATRRRYPLRDRPPGTPCGPPGANGGPAGTDRSMAVSPAPYCGGEK